jgi:hypothetical protein
MLATLLDVTGTVSIADARTVAEASGSILERTFGAGSFDRRLLDDTFALVARVFAGEHPGYLACDMPYHDLRHSLDTGLVVARLVAGYQREHAATAEALSPEAGLLGVVLGALHDTGYIRRESETGLAGPQLTAEHEARGVEFAEAYLRTTSLATHASLAGLILATRLATDPERLLASRDAWVAAVGRMLGAADLLSQLADPMYLERCYWHLYPELVLGGGDRVRGTQGEQLLFRDAFDLVAKTPTFYEHVVRKRLEGDFRQIAGHLGAHFDGIDPYAASVAANLRRAASIVTEGRRERLGPEPETTTRDLPAFYRTHAAQCAVRQ